MKTKTMIMLLIAAPILSMGQLLPVENFYSRQIGFALGINGTSLPTNKLGPTADIFYRFNRHVVGARYYGYGNKDRLDINFDGIPSEYMNCSTIYYGWTWSKEHSAISPAIGIGYVESQRKGQFIPGDKTSNSWFPVPDHYEAIQWSSACLELSVNATYMVKERGLGSRFFVNINDEQAFVGLSFYALVGKAWKKTSP